MHEDALSRSLLNHSKASSASATGARWRSVNRVNTAVNTSDSEAERTRHRDTHPAFAELGESPWHGEDICEYVGFRLPGEQIQET